jgi:hypothetical protein
MCGHYVLKEPLNLLQRMFRNSSSEIRRLPDRYRGFFSVGLRIERTQESLPEFIVFWTSLLFWNSAFERLRTQLARLGYDVAS